MRRLRPALCAVLLFALAVLASCQSAPPREGLDSLLLITVDTLRTDHVSAYSADSPVATPHIDALAARGLKATRAWCTVPITAPSHATILTGLSPLAHGVRNNYRYRIPEGVQTLAEELAEDGLATGAFVAAYTATREYGLDQGFAVFDDDFGHDANGRPRFQRPAGEVIDRALAWLEEHGDAPFFLWVHVFDPHSPYSPPAEYAKLHPKNPYAGEVAYTDAELGRLLTALESSPAAPHTAIVLTADHGEALGQHGEEEHGMLLYEPTVNVPLLVAAPGRVAPGTVHEGVASGMDIVPTALALLGKSAPSAVQGLDLLAADADPQRLVYAESLYAHEELGWSPLYTLRRGDLKYIAAPTPELYDVATDPGEHKNLAAERPEEMAAFQEALRPLQEAWLDEEWARAALGSEELIDEEAIARLRSLGYAAGGGIAGLVTVPPVAGRNPMEHLESYQLLMRAQKLTQAGDAAFAIKLLRRILDGDPGNPQYMLKLAVALAQDGQSEEAERTYRALLDTQPSFVVGLRYYAAFLVGDGRQEEARDLWYGFAEAYPGAVGAEAELARHEVALGNAAKAARRLESHLARQPGDAAAWVELANARTAAAEYGPAIDALAEVFERRASLTRALPLLETLAREHGQARRARGLLESALARGEDPALRAALTRVESY